MDFSDPREEFRQEVRAWPARDLTEELRREFEREITYLRVPMEWSPAVLEFNRRLGAKGWIGLHWPKKYGGGGGSLRGQLGGGGGMGPRHAKNGRSPSLPG